MPTVPWKNKFGEWSPCKTEEERLKRRREARARDYYKNKQRYAERRKMREALFPEKVANEKREWRKRNREKIAAYKNTPKNKVVSRVRNRLRAIIKAKRTYGKHYELIGCTPEFLCKWLESKFQDGMTWENSNLWHIDHIVPCNAFDLENEEQVKQCFHYSNLRPLWAFDNISKGAKIENGTQPELPIPMGPF